MKLRWKLNNLFTNSSLIIQSSTANNCTDKGTVNFPSFVVLRSSIIRSSIDFYKLRLNEVPSHRARVLYAGNDIIFHERWNDLEPAQKY